MVRASPKAQGPGVDSTSPAIPPLTSITVHGNINLEIYAARHAIRFRKSEELRCLDTEGTAAWTAHEP